MAVYRIMRPFRGHSPCAKAPAFKRRFAAKTNRYSAICLEGGEDIANSEILDFNSLKADNNYLMSVNGE